MGGAIGQSLPLAIGIAISPIPIVAIVLMLTTPSARSNGPAFVLGWVIGIALVGGLALLIFGSGGAHEDGGPATWVSYGKLALGVLLLVIAWRQWQKRPGAGQEAPMPEWMSSLDHFTPLRSMGAALGLAALNPKNLALILGGAAAISESTSVYSDQIIAMVVFTLVATLGPAIPVGIYFFMGDKADPILNDLKDRMAKGSAVIMAIICLIIGAKLIGDAITAL